MTPHPARVKKAEQAVVAAAMRRHAPWTRKYAEMLTRFPHAISLDIACARLYLARLASKKRKGVKRG